MLRLAVDPYSLEYLYLVQQSKRVSLSASISRLRPRYFLISPLIVAIVVGNTGKTPGENALFSCPGSEQPDSSYV